MTVKIAYENVRRMTSRGWRTNALLILSFFAVLAFLNFVRNLENGSTEVIKVLHISEDNPESMRMKEVISYSDDKKLTIRASRYQL